MSKNQPNAKKPKTASALNFKFVDLFFLIVVIFSLVLLFTVNGLKAPADKACFKNACIDVEKATTPVERAEGLSGRYKLLPNHGMMFVFDNTANECMWMKDMKFDLDMVWMNESGKIIKIAQNLGPGTYPESFCADGTKYVLEVNAGTAECLGLNIGNSARL